MRILVTRPKQDTAELTAALEGLGHSVLIEPLLSIELIPEAVGDIDGAAALIATSRHGLRALAASVGRERIPFEMNRNAAPSPLVGDGREQAELGAANTANDGVPPTPKPSPRRVEDAPPARWGGEHRRIESTDVENTLAIAIKLPLYVVGPATAALGRELGFTDVRGGGGAAVELADRILADFAPGQGPLVHLAGDHLAGDLGVRLSANGFGLIERVVYQSRAATALSQTCIGAFKAGQIGGVILLSPRTAVLYGGLIAAHGLLDCMRGVAHFCISQAVAAQLEPLQPVEIAIAPRPNLDEVLALVKGRAGTQQSG